MTLQISDIFIYNEQKYNISSIQSPNKFFQITTYGIFPEPEHTADLRGYQAEFSIHNNTLVLKNLKTNNSNGKAEPVMLNGILPSVIKPERLSDRYKEWRGWHYNDINLKLPYSGSVLITSEFIGKYVHMGFHSPKDYKNVIELTFEKGMFLGSDDVSDIAARLRDEISETNEKENLAQWVADRFNLSYDVKWTRM